MPFSVPLYVKGTCSLPVARRVQRTAIMSVRQNWDSLHDAPGYRRCVVFIAAGAMRHTAWINASHTASFDARQLYG